MQPVRIDLDHVTDGIRPKSGYRGCREEHSLWSDAIGNFLTLMSETILNAITYDKHGEYCFPVFPDEVRPSVNFGLPRTPTLQI